jgi:hypothetical protein
MKWKYINVSWMLKKVFDVHSTFSRNGIHSVTVAKIQDTGLINDCALMYVQYNLIGSW